MNYVYVRTVDVLGGVWFGGVRGVSLREVDYDSFAGVRVGAGLLPTARSLTVAVPVRSVGYWHVPHDRVRYSCHFHVRCTHARELVDISSDLSSDLYLNFFWSWFMSGFRHAGGGRPGLARCRWSFWG